MGTPVKQVRLEIKERNTVRETITWIDRVKELKVGRRVELRGKPGEFWTIVEVGDKIVDSDTLYARGRSSFGESIHGELPSDKHNEETSP